MALRSSMGVIVAGLTLLAACKDGDSNGEHGGTEGDAGETTAGDGDGDVECEPQGDSFAAFTLQNLDDPAEIDWDLLCTLDNVAPHDGGLGFVISLNDCASQSGGDDQPLVELSINSKPATAPLPLAQPGDRFRLRYVAPPLNGGRWFTLRNDPGGTLLLAGLDGQEVLPSSAPDLTFAPLEIELVDIGCAPSEDPPQCGDAVRQALLVTFGDDVATISDRNYGYVGQLASYQIIGDWLREFPLDDCDGFPDRLLRALIFSIPEG